MNRPDAEAIITTLALVPHPEGGWYRESFRHKSLEGGRGVLTQIYFLLRRGERSRWHRIDAFEVWHFYAGDPLALQVAETEDSPRTIVLGASFAEGQVAHAVVPAGAWQSATPLGEYALLGCTAAPAFEFAGFELAPEGWRPGGGPEA